MNSLSTNNPVASDRPIFYVYLALLLWLPLPFGSNATWAWSMMEVCVLMLSLAWLVQYFRRKVWFTVPFERAWPAVVCLGAVLAWIEFQAVALPNPVLGLLSPASLELHNGLESYPSISLDVNATRASALKSLSYFLLFCLTLLLVTDKARVKVLAQIIVIGGLIQAAYGALMAFTGLEYNFFFEKVVDRGLATGTFVQSGHLASYLEMSLAVGIGLMLGELSGRKAANWRESARRTLRTLLGSRARVRLAIVVMAIGLVVTRSWMGNAAFVLSLAIAGGFYLLFVRRIPQTTLAFFASLLLIDLVIVGNLFATEGLTEQIQITLVEFEQRDTITQDILQITQDYPLAGSGAGSFSSIFPMYNSGSVIGPVNSASNDYLQFASEFGLLAFGLLGLMVLASLWTAISAQLIRKNRLMQGMGFAASMSILSMLLHSAIGNALQVPAIASLFVVTLALAWIARYCDPLSTGSSLRRRRATASE